LIELIVAMMIIMFLLALVAAFITRFQDQQRAAKGADMLQGWLLIAKQRAIRDQAPTGLRLMTDSDGYVRVLQHIQQPDAYWGGSSSRLVSASKNTAQFKGARFTGGQGSQNLWPVQPGDYLEISGGGLLHRITSVSSESLSWAVNDPLPYDVTEPTSSYRVVRSPRLVPGESMLQLPQNVVIDISQSTIKYQPPFASDKQQAPFNYDIVFGPGGGLVGKGTVNDMVILWVRDVSLDNAPGTGRLLGSPTLIAVATRTGSIAAHPVNPGLDPFLFAKDGRSSGM
jgi:type II secretory pathway pseudopilin PulG